MCGFSRQDHPSCIIFMHSQLLSLHFYHAQLLLLASHKSLFASNGPFTLSTHPIHDLPFGIITITSDLIIFFTKCLLLLSPDAQTITILPVLLNQPALLQLKFYLHLFIPSSIHSQDSTDTSQTPNLHYIQYPLHCCSHIPSFSLLQPSLAIHFK